MKKSTSIAATGFCLEAGLACLSNLAGSGMVWRLVTAQGALKKVFWAGVSAAGVFTSCWISYAMAAQATEMYLEAKMEEDNAEDSVEEF